MQKLCINKIPLCSQLACEITVVVHWKWLWTNTFVVILFFIFIHARTLMWCFFFLLVFYEWFIFLFVSQGRMSEIFSFLFLISWVKSKGLRSHVHPRFVSKHRAGWKLSTIKIKPLCPFSSLSPLPFTLSPALLFFSCLYRVFLLPADFCAIPSLTLPYPLLITFISSFHVWLSLPSFSLSTPVCLFRFLYRSLFECLTLWSTSFLNCNSPKSLLSKD